MRTGSPPAGAGCRIRRTPSCTGTGTWRRNTRCWLEAEKESGKRRTHAVLLPHEIHEEGRGTLNPRLGGAEGRGRRKQRLFPMQGLVDALKLSILGTSSQTSE